MMDEQSSDSEPAMTRIQQLERERDQLHKDIEQLCMQQAGPSYLAVATRMHFQRTASLEQDIENLKKKLTSCMRENSNLQEELSEAYRIKGQLSDLHAAEVSKNVEAEKQVKFFQGCVAAAFAERDNSLMEAETAKENEEVVSQKLGYLQKRIEDLSSECLEQKLLNERLQSDLANKEEFSEIITEVVNKFYNLREGCHEGLEEISWDEKCKLLCHDPSENWSFSDSSSSRYISALEKELKKLRVSVDSLKNKLRMGLDIENHLKRKVHELERKNNHFEKVIMKGILELRHCHSQHRAQIVNLLNVEQAYFKSISDVIDEKLRAVARMREQNLESSYMDATLNECRDVYMTPHNDATLMAEVNCSSLPDTVANETGDVSKALERALQEKVSTLLLLSQQEERHLLERNVSVVLQKKVEELQRNLLQVTNEKVRALMEFARVKQENQILREKLADGLKQGKQSDDIGENRILSPPERGGRLKNLLKRTYLKQWISAVDSFGNNAESHLSEGDLSSRRPNSTTDYARLQIDNVTLKESIESLGHLTSSIQRLRLLLAKVKEPATPGDATAQEVLEEVISDAKLVRTALGSSLPVSWSAEADYVDREIDPSEVISIDPVSSAGFEMVDLLLVAAEALKSNASRHNYEVGI